MSEQVDVVVVGLGVGGEEVAGRLAEAGLSVVGIEDRLVGGECPYWACIPSKMMIRAGNLLAETGRVLEMAGTATAQPDWTPVAERIRKEATDYWDDTVAVDRFTGKGGRFVRGRARLLGSGRVAAGGQVFQTRRGVVLATGTVPMVPPIDGLAGTPYWTNREAIEAEVLPESLVVLGGGAVGLELAQVFSRFGVTVTVVEVTERLLPIEEPEASGLIHQVLVNEGVAVHTGARDTCRARRRWVRCATRTGRDDPGAAGAGCHRPPGPVGRASVSTWWGWIPSPPGWRLMTGCARATVCGRWGM